MSQSANLRHLLNLLPRLARLDERPVDEVCRLLGLKLPELLTLIKSASELAWGEHGQGELVDIWVERGRLHVHMGGLFEQVVRLVPQELLALRLGAAQLTAAGLDQSLHGLEKLLGSIEEGLGGDESPAERLHAMVGAEPDPALEPATLETVLRAHRHKRLLRVWYFSQRAERLRPRLIEPWRPFQEGGHWYLLGLDRELGQERVFRLDRVANLQELEEGFDAPPPSRMRNHGATPRDGAHVARVRLKGALARLAREQDWRGMLPASSSDGSILQELTWSDKDALLRSLLPWAPEVEILEPAEMVDAWRALIAEMLARHAGGPAPKGGHH